MKQVLIIVLHRPDRSPSQRFRFEQYLPYLEKQGYAFTFSCLLSARDDTIYYSRGHWWGKFKILLKSLWQRSKDVWRASRYDIVFIQREAFMLGTAFFERLFALSKANVIFDFDDAIWLPNVSEANRALGWLKNPQKVPVIIAKADFVMAGNIYLADYARQYNSQVRVIPSTIDTDHYTPPASREGTGRVCIGWSGSPTTIEHFKLIIPALCRVREQFGKQVVFKVIGVPDFHSHLLGVTGTLWSAATEVRDLSEIDIGVMPLPDEEWSRGKCAMKALQYMALEIPPVVSPVGMNREVIDPGENGLFADHHEEWVRQLTRLAKSASLRQSMGKKARQTVEQHYSVKGYQPVYRSIFDQLANNDSSVT